MGQSKQLLDVNGEPLLRCMCRTVLASSVKHVAVVLGSYAEHHRQVIGDLEVDVIDNPEWAKGMGNSLKAGLKGVLSKDSSIPGIVVMVCDQPKVDNGLINKIISAHERTGKPLVACRYDQTVGVPAFFGKKYFDALASLEDDHGAKAILLRNPDDVAIIDFPEGKVDLDTMSDYKNFINHT